MSKTDNYPYPTPITAKIWGCFFWSRSVMLVSAERGEVRLANQPEIISQEFQPIWLRHLNVTNGQTNRRTDRLLSLAIPRDAMLRVVKSGSISKTRRDSANVTLNGLHKIVYCLSFAAKMFDLDW